MRFSATSFFTVLCFCLFAVTAYAQEIALNRVVAVINGDPITLHEVEMQSLPAFAQAQINPNDPVNSNRVQEIIKSTLNDMIIDKLISQDAERLGITTSDEDVNAEVQNIITRNNLSSEFELERALASQGLDLQTFKQRLRGNIINSRLTNQMVSRQIIIPRADIERYYAENKERFIYREVDFQLLVFNPAMTPADIQNVVKMIKNGKVSFAEAVQKYSVGPASSSDGVVKGASWRELSTEIQMALETTTVGQMTDVINVGGQPMLLTLLHLGEPVQASLNEVYDEIEATIKMPLAKARFDEYVNQLRDKAVIDVRM